MLFVSVTAHLLYELGGTYIGYLEEGPATMHRSSRLPLYNYRMAQPMQWVPAILDYMKKAQSHISTVVLAPNSSSDSSLVVNCIFL